MHALQLLANAFFANALIFDMRLWESFARSAEFKGQHYVFETGVRLPPMTIRFFADSNGIVIHVGDRSHPKAVEVEAVYPDWAERNESLLAQIRDSLNPKPVEQPKTSPKELVYVA